MKSLATSLLLLAGCVLLASCSTMAPVEIPEKVYLDRPVPCVDPEKRPKRPATTPEAALFMMDRGSRTMTAYRDLKAMEAWAAEADAVIEGCSRLPGVKPPPG